MKKVLVFSPPFSGHLNTIKDLIHELEGRVRIQLAITGWKNIAPDLQGLKTAPFLLQRSRLRETDPGTWTLARAVELLPDVFRLIDRQKPDLILYDFFSIEAAFAAMQRSIPYWCSIPAMIGPFIHQQTLRSKLALRTNQQALKRLDQQFQLKLRERDFEMISDGFHFPGQRNLVWSYPSLVPANFMNGRKKVPYFFVGNLRGRGRVLNRSSKPSQKHNSHPVVYLSLGTVVMNNLWNQQPAMRHRLLRFFEALGQRWADSPFDVVCVTQGKKVLRRIPPHWKMLDDADQVEELHRASVFVTHGGSNSFHEAVLQRVPMVVLPFFGDQPLVGKRVERLELGMCLVKNEKIDTKKAMPFINALLATRVDAAVRSILRRSSTYALRFEQLPLKAVSLGSLFKDDHKAP